MLVASRWVVRLQLGWLLVSLSLVLLVPVTSSAQDAANVPDQVLNFPQVIFYNGKVVTMDDVSLQPNPGIIGQAMAIRDGKVLAVGTNDSMLRLANARTRKIDLKGRTVLPGLVVTHDHLQDWVLAHDAVIESVLSDRDLVSRVVAGRTEKELEDNLVPTLRRALDSAQPGEWVVLNLFRGEHNEVQEIAKQLLNSGKIPRETLDKYATRNPVAVRAKNTIFLNQVAIDAIRKRYSEGSPSDYVPPESVLKNGMGGTDDNRVIMGDLVLGNKPELLERLYKAEMEWWAGYGITAYHSVAMSGGVLNAFSALDRRNQMPIRFAWSYSLGNRYTPYLLANIAALIGKGSAHFWLLGVDAGVITSCTTLPVTKYPISGGGDGLYHDNCIFQPGSYGFQAIKDLVKAGIPVRNLHTGPLADKDLDYFLQAIAEAAREAHLSDEQVRAQRQAMDHCGGAPRPDQIPLLKKYGIIASCKPLFVYFELLDNLPLFGERYAEWVSPRRSLLDGGVMTTTELDRAIGTMTFTPFSVNLYTDITRKARDGKVYVPKEAIDRVSALKAHTIWGAHYLFRENELGSLGPGKWADFIILDRDYMTIPEDDIPKIQVLATAVGGKFVHVRKEIAAELGESPKGSQALLK